jgi:tRNA(fMet)-specific endonuclease VapC
MPRYMLDTNICIYAIKGRPAALGERFGEVAEELCISTITLAELFYGVENSERCVANLREVEQFVGRLDILSFDELAAVHYGQIRAGLRRAGTMIGGQDLLIAAHARSASLSLVTNNLREFRRVPGLQLENWIA